MSSSLATPERPSSPVEPAKPTKPPRARKPKATHAVVGDAPPPAAEEESDAGYQPRIQQRHQRVLFTAQKVDDDSLPIAVDSVDWRHTPIDEDAFYHPPAPLRDRLGFVELADYAAVLWLAGRLIVSYVL